MRKNEDILECCENRNISSPNWEFYENKSQTKISWTSYLNKVTNSLFNFRIAVVSPFDCISISANVLFKFSLSFFRIRNRKLDTNVNVVMHTYLTRNHDVLQVQYYLAKWVWASIFAAIRVTLFGHICIGGLDIFSFQYWFKINQEYIETISDPTHIFDAHYAL